jgi:hypothetical protein
LPYQVGVITLASVNQYVPLLPNTHTFIPSFHKIKSKKKAQVFGADAQRRGESCERRESGGGGGGG